MSTTPKKEIDSATLLIERRKRPCLNSDHRKLLLARSSTISNHQDGHNQLLTKRSPPSVAVVTTPNDGTTSPNDVINGDRSIITSAFPPPTMMDNPFYFTIPTSPPEEPDMLFHKSIPDISPQVVQQTTSPTKQREALNKLLSKLNPLQISLVSPLARKLALLRLNCSVLDVSSINNESSPSCSNVSNVAVSKSFETSVNTSAKDDDVINDDILISDSHDRKTRIRKLRKVKRKSAYSDCYNNNRTPLTTVIHGSNSSNSNCCSSSENHLNSGGIEEAKKTNVKRRCVVFDEKTFNLNTPVRTTDSPCRRVVIQKSDSAEAVTGENSSSSRTSIDLDDGPSTLKRQKVIRKPKKKIIDRSSRRRATTFESCLTLPDGIPSPLECSSSSSTAVNRRFRILSPATTTIVEPDDDDDKSDDCPAIIEDRLLNEANTIKDNTMISTLINRRESVSPPLNRQTDVHSTEATVTMESIVTWNSHENRRSIIDQSVIDDLSQQDSSIKDRQELFTTSSTGKIPQIFSY